MFSATWVLIVMTFTTAVGNLENEPRLVIYEFTSEATCRSALRPLLMERAHLERKVEKGGRVIWRAWCQKR